MKEIKLSSGAFTLVDDADFALLSRWFWTDKGGYAAREDWNDGSPAGIYMHRQIMQPPEGFIVDHRNHDTLDNRRANLRVCTQHGNMHNQRPQVGGSSKYKGVSWNKAANKWTARITIDNNTRHIGVFTDEIEAAKAYDRAARYKFGEFAYTNFDK